MLAETLHIGPEWDRPEADLLEFDRRVHTIEGRPIALHLEVGRPEEVLLRYQRLWPWRNEASRTEAFRAVERAHRRLHDISLPLVRADLDHAVDTWQWVLRLEPFASVELQLAALLHDVERLGSEAVERVEHEAQDYVAFKQAHAEVGARRAAALLSPHFGARTVERVAALIAGHEQPRADLEGRLLNDADALSYFSLNCAGYLAWFGPDQTRRKVAYTLDRLRPAARSWLARMRLPTAVRAMVLEAGRAPPGLVPG